jgi:hypothetical protein
MNVGPYLTIAEAAEYLAVSPRTVRRRLREIPHSDCDFGPRFTRRDLDIFMERYKVKIPMAKRRSGDEVLASIGIGQRGSKGVRRG